MKTEHQPQLLIYRNRNKSLIRKAMNNLDWEANNDQADLAKQNQYSMEQLKAMQLVAKMKEAADRAGAGFVGGFITPTGQRFMMSNVDESDAQHQAILAQLDAVQKQAVEDAEIGFFDAFQNKIRIVESDEGVQLIIEPEAE